MPLHDHPYSEVNIIYSVVKRGKEPRTGEQIQPQTLKCSVTGNTDLDNYILSSRVAPDTTDADVHVQNRLY